MLLRKQRFHQGIHRGDDHAARILRQMPHHVDAPSGDEIAVDIGIVEQEVSGRIDQHIPVKGAVVLRHLLYLLLILGHNQRPGRAVLKGCRKVHLLGTGAAVHLQGSAALYKVLLKLLVFGKLCKRSVKCLSHLLPVFPVFPAFSLM